jgi:hypothetical protein
LTPYLFSDVLVLALVFELMQLSVVGKTSIAAQCSFSLNQKKNAISAKPTGRNVIAAATYQDHGRYSKPGLQYGKKMPRNPARLSVFSSRFSKKVCLPLPLLSQDFHRNSKRIHFRIHFSYLENMQQAERIL